VADYFFLYIERIPCSQPCLDLLLLSWEGAKHCLESALGIGRDARCWESSREQGDHALLAVWVKDDLELMKWTQRDGAVEAKGQCSGALTEQEQNEHSSREQDPPHNIYS